jgi:cytochrome c-type biogenesis protein CcsB
MTAAALAVETPLHVLALAVYAVAAGSVLLGAALDRQRLSSFAHMAALVGLAIHALAIVARWYGVGHGPYLTRYEVLSSNAWAAMALFQLVTRRQPKARSVAVFLYPAALIVLGVGVYTGPEIKMLPPTFTGIWLVLHVSFYFVAFSSALLSLSYGLLHILHPTRMAQRLKALPDAGTLDRESYRFAGLTFAFWGIGMLTGAIWAYYSWGRFWGWDPIETWSLVTWFVYGIYLHARRFYGLKGRRAALLLVVGFVLAVGSLFFTSLLSSSLHSEYFR